MLSAYNPLVVRMHHRSVCIVPPVADSDLLQAALAGGEECRMPAKQSLSRQGLRVAGGCVQHHLDDAVGIAVGRHQAVDMHAEPPCQRGSDLFPVKSFALDLAGAGHIWA